MRLFLLDAARPDDDPIAPDAAIDEIGRLTSGTQGAAARYAQAVRLVAQARSGNWPLAQARSLLHAAMNRRPLSSRALVLMAELSELGGSFSGAIGYLRQATDLGDRTPSVLRHIVELLYRENRFAEADQALRTFDEQSVPFSAELRSRSAAALLRVTNYHRVSDLTRRAADHTERCDDSIWLGQLLTRLRRDDQAELAFRKATKSCALRTIRPGWR